MPQRGFNILPPPQCAYATKKQIHEPRASAELASSTTLLQLAPSLYHVPACQVLAQVLQHVRLGKMLS